MVHQDISSKPKLWFVNQCVGADWCHALWRQVAGINRLQAHVICWVYEGGDINNADVPVHVVGFDPSPYNGASRWLHRLRTLRNLPSINFYSTVGSERRALVKLYQQTKPAVILCHFGFVALRLVPLARQLNVPLIAHFHGCDISSMLRNRWYRWSLVRGLSYFSAIIVVGSHQRQWMLEHGVSTNRVHLIPMGTPTELFRPGVRKASGRIRFVAVSRLAGCKGIDYTIRAFERVVRELPDAELHIVGHGPMRDELEALAGKLGLHNNVVFYGRVGEDEVINRLQNCDVFVQHSLEHSDGSREGFGVSITEASACGLPVVVTRCGGIEDQVRDGQTGICVPQRDVGAMAEAMLKLARDQSLRERLGKASRARAVSQYDLSRQIERLENVLVSAIVATEAPALSLA